MRQHASSQRQQLDNASLRGGARHSFPNGDGPLAGVFHGAAAQREAAAVRVDPLQPRDGQAAALLLDDVELAVLPRLKLQRINTDNVSKAGARVHCSTD